MTTLDKDLEELQCPTWEMEFTEFWGIIKEFIQIKTQTTPKLTKLV